MGLWDIVDRAAFLLVRQQATNMAWRSLDKRRGCGRGEGGHVYEQETMLSDGNPAGRALHVRCTILWLDGPVRDGERQIHLLTNLPKPVASAKRIARLYARRSTLETAFEETRQMIDGEIQALACPHGTLFSLSIALVA